MKPRVPPGKVMVLTVPPGKGKGSRKLIEFERPALFCHKIEKHEMMVFFPNLCYMVSDIYSYVLIQ